MANNFSFKPISRSRGRPGEFDVDDALDRAVPVFSERDYHATSIAGMLPCVVQGVSGVGKIGRRRAELRSVVDVTMKLSRKFFLSI